MANVKPVRTEADHKAALARIDALMGAAEGTPESEELDVLVDLVEHYEERNDPFGYPDPIEAIRFHMDQQMLSERDLPWLGDPATVAAILAGDEALTLPMARALHERFGIPAESLLREPANV